MRIYLAARYSRYPEIQGYAKELEALGHTVTSRWIQGDHELRADGEAETDTWAPVWAMEDYHDLLQAEVMISFTEPPGDTPGRNRGGRHVEYGIALEAGKRCLIVGHREHVFHYLPFASVAFYATWEACRATLDKECDEQRIMHMEKLLEES